MPPFDTQYGVWLAIATTALIELILMMVPAPLPALTCATIRRAAAWPTRNAPLRFTRSTRSKSACVRSRKSAPWMMPALLTKMSRSPNARQVSATTFSALPASPTSVATKWAWPRAARRGPAGGGRAGGGGAPPPRGEVGGGDREPEAGRGAGADRALVLDPQAPPPRAPKRNHTNRHCRPRA